MTHLRTYKPILTVAAALALLAGFAGQASALGSDTIKVRFEQPVRVAQTTLPAGVYLIRSVDTGGDTPVLSFSSDHGPSILVPAMHWTTAAHDLSDKTEVLLEARNGELQLTQIRLAGRGYVYEIIPAHPSR